MGSRTNNIRRCRGMSLVGAMVAVVILLIALIGTSSFRYCAAMDARKADAQTTAARVALMLCESWRGISGDVTYDPVAHLGTDLDITQSTEGPAKPSDFTLLGSYVAELDDVHDVTHYATLSWKDVQPGLRALNVIVAWAQRGPGQDGNETVDKSFRLTIYTVTW
ncbi:MAG: type IV pilus modification PilV family protein [Planctomycetota bacterium]